MRRIPADTGRTVRRVTRAPGRTAPAAAPRPARRPGCRTVLAALALGAVGYLVYGSPAFEIRHVECLGPEPCKSIVAEAVPLGGNLFAFRSSAVVSVLREQPIVESVQVLRIPPGTLRVRVTPRTPYVRVRLANGDFLADRKGVLFAPVEEPGELPLLVGAEVSAIRDWRIPPEILRCATLWLDAARRRSLPAVAKLDYRGDGRANLALAGGMLLKVGSAEDSERKLLAAEALLPGLAPDVEYIDLELAELPVLGHRHAVEVESSESAPPPDGPPLGKANGPSARKKEQPSR